MEKEFIEDDGVNTSGKKKKGISGLVAFLICLVLAFVIWCYAKGGFIKEQMEAEGSTTPEIETVATGSEK